MKKHFIAGLLVFVLVLTGCGSSEMEESIAAPATTTAATFDMSNTSATTTSENTAITENTTATTSEFPREIYEVDFPIEFSENYSFGNWTILTTEKDYKTQVSPEAEKFFNDYFTFATDNMNAESYDPEHPSYYENGCFYQYPAGMTFYGLVDINSDGLPEVFKFLTYSDRNTSKIYFYDRDTKSLLTDEDIYGFNLDEGATYFGKNKDGNLLICKGYPHSNYMGYFIIAELLINENDEKLIYNESFRADFGLFNNVFACRGYSVNGEQYGENYDITAAEFESAYREFYDAIDFDVYWICGDILYHGAEETEYRGKMAYEKYLEFTKKQEYLAEKSNYDDTKILIDDINNDGTDDIIYINNWSATFAYYHNAEIKEIRAEANWGGKLEGGGAPLYYNKKTNEFLTVSTASIYKNYSFYGYSDGEYELQDEYIWRELKIPLDDDGSFDRVNQYTIGEKEVTEAERQKAVDDFINDDDTVLLCPDNADLDFTEVRE